MKVRAYITHKQAEKYSDCQDFFSINTEKQAIAISDGVSQSIFPQWLAEILCDYFVKEEGWNLTDYLLPDIKEAWKVKVDEYIKQKESEGGNPWRLKNSIQSRMGAGATLCGIRCHCGNNEWNAHILGDSALVCIDKNNKIVSINTSMDNFGFHPDYFDSFLPTKGKPKTLEGELKDGEKLFLVSDPFGELFDKEKDGDRIQTLIGELLAVDSHESFCDLVQRWRDSYSMHNDDSTFVCIEYDGDNKFNVNHKDDLKELIEQEKEKEKAEKKQETIPTKSSPETKSEAKITETEKTSETKSYSETTEQETNAPTTSTSETKSEVDNSQNSALEQERERFVNLLKSVYDRFLKNQDMKCLDEEGLRIIKEVEKELKL